MVVLGSIGQKARKPYTPTHRLYVRTCLLLQLYGTAAAINFIELVPPVGMRVETGTVNDLPAGVQLAVYWKQPPDSGGMTDNASSSRTKEDALDGALLSPWHDSLQLVRL